jgi:hypothetical protein
MAETQRQRSGDHSTLIQAAGNVEYGMSASEARQFIEDALSAKLGTSTDAKQALPSSFPGWLRLTPEYVAGRKARVDLSEYFDGASPDWRDICHPGLQPRPIVKTVVDNFSEATSLTEALFRWLSAHRAKGRRLS